MNSQLYYAPSTSHHSPTLHNILLTSSTEMTSFCHLGDGNQEEDQDDHVMPWPFPSTSPVTMQLSIWPPTHLPSPQPPMHFKQTASCSSISLSLYWFLSINTLAISTLVNLLRCAIDNSSSFWGVCFGWVLWVVVWWVVIGGWMIG